MDAEKGKVAIILHSGSYDRVSYAISIASTALALGMDAHMLFTYGGLKRLAKNHIDNLGEETSEDIRQIVARGLALGHIESISTLLKDAKRMGLKVYACVAAMAALNIARGELVDEVDRSIGLATFLELARDASITLYI